MKCDVGVNEVHRRGTVCRLSVLKDRGEKAKEGFEDFLREGTTMPCRETDAPRLFLVGMELALELGVDFP